MKEESRCLPVEARADALCPENEAWALEPLPALRAIAVLGGQSLAQVQGRDMWLLPGDVLLLPPDTALDGAANRALRALAAVFPPDFLAGVSPLFSPDAAPEVLRPREEEWRVIAFLLDAAQKESQARRDGWRPCVSGYFTSLLILLSRLRSPQARVPGEQREGLAQAIRFLNAHYTEDVALDALAEKAGISPRHLDRLFQEEMGMPPKKYIIRLRIDRACFLLRRTEKSITDVAFECGYTDSNYFARVFRKSRGLSPQQYRKNAMGGE